jgi:hypothetical protein
VRAMCACVRVCVLCAGCLCAWFRGPTGPSTSSQTTQKSR